MKTVDLEKFKMEKRKRVLTGCISMLRNWEFPDSLQKETEDLTKDLEVLKEKYDVALAKKETPI